MILIAKTSLMDNIKIKINYPNISRLQQKQKYNKMFKKSKTHFWFLFIEDVQSGSKRWRKLCQMFSPLNKNVFVSILF